MTPRSSLARHVGQSPLDADDLERMKAEAWRRHGIAVVRPEELGSDWVRRGVEAEMTERYGQRRSGG